MMTLAMAPRVPPLGQSAALRFVDDHPLLVAGGAVVLLGLFLHVAGRGERWLSPPDPDDSEPRRGVTWNSRARRWQDANGKFVSGPIVQRRPRRRRAAAT